MLAVDLWLPLHSPPGGDEHGHATTLLTKINGGVLLSRLDDFVVLWKRHGHDWTWAEYAQALARLHAGLRWIEVPTPHVMDRVAATRRDVADRDVAPDLAETDRVLLADTLRDLGRSIVDRRGAEQLLHGEPHPFNILDTRNGPLFVDFENTARGPVEYDLAWAPREVVQHYPDADQDLVGECRGIVLAIVAAHRWRRDDQHPSGRESGVAFLRAVREGPPWPTLDEVVW